MLKEVYHKKSNQNTRIRKLQSEGSSTTPGTVGQTDMFLYDGFNKSTAVIIKTRLTADRSVRGRTGSDLNWSSSSLSTFTDQDEQSAEN